LAELRQQYSDEDLAALIANYSVIKFHGFFTSPMARFPLRLLQ
jgi:hypothetical protein